MIQSWPGPAVRRRKFLLASFEGLDNGAKINKFFEGGDVAVETIIGVPQHQCNPSGPTTMCERWFPEFLGIGTIRCIKNCASSYELSRSDKDS